MRNVVVETGRIVPYIEEVGPEIFEPDPDYEDLSDEEMTALAARVATEERRRQTAAKAAVAVEKNLQTYEAAQGFLDGTLYVPATGSHNAVRPGGTRVFDGDLYENVSGVRLAFSPTEYPLGWELVSEDTEPVSPEPEDHEEWEVGKDYTIFTETTPLSIVTFAGIVYTCVQGHTSLAGWEPPNVPALWNPVP